MISMVWSALRPRRHSPAMDEAYQQVCEMLFAAKRTIVLTGAGVSTRSGIPDFRSPESGLWKHRDPFTVASIWGFREDPQAFYDWVRPLARKIQSAQPNAAHRALADLEAAGLVDLIITQNIDNLHQQAGSRHVIQVHGSTQGATCPVCHFSTEEPGFWDHFLLDGSANTLPRCPQCNAVLKPNVVLFGEDLPHEDLVRAQQAALECDLVLAVGTSLEVMPAADLPLLAKRRGAHLAILNMGGTLADNKADVILREDVVVSLPRITQRCRSMATHRFHAR